MKLAILAMKTLTPEQNFRICSAVGEKLRHAPDIASVIIED